MYLTRAGQDALDSVRVVQRAEVLEAIKDWSLEDQRTFARLLDRFSTAFLAWAVEDALATIATAEGRLSIGST